MKRLLIVAAICVIAAPAFAGVDIQPINGMGYLSYNVETGQVTPATADTRYGPPIWSSTQSSGYFWGMDLGELGLDWGDIAGPAVVGGFGFTEFTNSQDSYGNAWAVIMFYAEENGWESTGRIAIVGFLIDNIPTSTHPPDEYWGYTWGVEPTDPFIIDGSDMDLDGLVDFGYAQWFVWPQPGTLMGPSIAGDPNAVPPTAPGIENVFDLFFDPNLFTDPNLQTGFQGTYWFGGVPFAQFYMELFKVQCPNQGPSGRYCSADIALPFDCIVDLADLAQLLANYPMTTGATLLDGDVDPYDYWFPGDGDVDLGDLAELLSQYGDDCNWP